MAHTAPENPRMKAGRKQTSRSFFYIRRMQGDGNDMAGDQCFPWQPRFCFELVDSP